jgi:putative molybdopterin biosynthesis protein
MDLISAKELAKYLRINEKKVYKLVQESKVPHLKIGGKIVFARELIDRWILESTVRGEQIFLAGSDDMLLRRLTDLYNGVGHTTVFYAPVGSINGLRLLKEGAATMSSVHILDIERKEYNFSYVRRYLPGEQYKVVHLFMREQGIYLPKGNPKNIRGLSDLQGKEVRFLNRNPGSGTRLLFDFLLHENGIDPERINGYGTEAASHLQVGLSVLRGEAGAGFGIRHIAHFLDLDFISLHKERFEMVIPEEHFASPPTKGFLSFFEQPALLHRVHDFTGYDTEKMGSVVYP